MMSLDLSVNDLKKAFKNPLVILLIVILVTVISYFTGYNFGFRDGRKEGRNEEEQSCSKQIDKICGTMDNKKGKNNEQKLDCLKKMFNSNEHEWDTRLYRKRSDGFWCPKSSNQAPVMWYEEGVNINFKKITLEYIVINDKSLKERVNFPSFIFAFGKDKPAFKSYYPEGEHLQLFGFEKNQSSTSSGQIFKREEPYTLPDPVKIGEDITNFYTLEPNHIEGNDLIINIKLNYTSAVTDKGITETIPKKVKMQSSDISSSSEKYPFGIGTYKGNCIKPISYEICD